MKFQRKRREKVDITLISMIDVLFVLLLFFMISTTFNKHSRLKINLPEAKGTEVEKEPKNVTVEIDAKGTYVVVDSEGKSRQLPNQSREVLTIELSRVAQQAADLPFVIKADGNTPNKSVMMVLDIAGQVGFNHISFPTQEPESAVEE